MMKNEDWDLLMPQVSMSEKTMKNEVRGLSVPTGRSRKNDERCRLCDGSDSPTQGKTGGSGAPLKIFYLWMKKPLKILIQLKNILICAILIKNYVVNLLTFTIMKILKVL